ncbi:MAG: cysteine desulfurase [Deltaproteobacteria bacterium]|nr:cysteine desulfurase [Deltaproteobacteria bacterium]
MRSRCSPTSRSAATMSTSDHELASLVAQGLAAIGLSASPSVGELPTSGITPTGATQRGLRHSGLPVGGLPVAGLPRGGFPQGAIPQSGIPQSGIPQSGIPSAPSAGWFPTSGAPGVSREPRVGLIDELASVATELPYFLSPKGPSPEGLAAPSVSPTVFGPSQQRFEIPLADPGGLSSSTAGSSLDVASIRRDFPILHTKVNGKPLVWLDNAATTQKPRAVIDRLTYFYENENSNIHRAAHTLAGRATDAYESARDSVRRFLHAGSTDDIVFVRGATEGINLLAKAWGGKHVGPGDEIVLTHLEHHSNIVPWQMLADSVGAHLRVIPVDDDGQIRLDEAERLIGPRTKIVSATHVSNALGTVVPVRELARIAHRYGARILVDGAQAVSHMPVDVQALEADFYVFSGHKVFGPTGIGAIYGRPDAWGETPPWQGGGNMIVDVTFAATKYAGIPARFEAGTGNIADAVGLGAALDYLEGIGMDRVAAHEEALLDYGTARLQQVPGLHLVGTAEDKAGVLSFVLDGHRPEEVGKHLDRHGIAVRSGHHCAQPALRRFGHEATVRPSLALYNTKGDLDCLLEALLELVRRDDARR